MVQNLFGIYFLMQQGIRELQHIHLIAFHVMETLIHPSTVTNVLMQLQESISGEARVKLRNLLAQIW